MLLLLAFMFGVILLTIWELRGGPRWRAPLVIATCAVLSLAFLSQRVV
jgi:hypothetical protein